MQKGSATGRGRLLVSSCHARARARLWRNDSRYNLHRCTSTARKRELDKFPGPRAIDLQIYTNKGREGTGRRCIARNETTDDRDRRKPGDISHLSAFETMARHEGKEQQSWEGREASGTVRTRPSSAPLPPPPPPPRRFAAGDRLCTYVRRTYWKRRHLAQMTIWDSETWRGEEKSE